MGYQYSSPGSVSAVTGNKVSVKGWMTSNLAPKCDGDATFAYDIPVDGTCGAASILNSPVGVKAVKAAAVTSGAGSTTLSLLAALLALVAAVYAL